MKRKGWKDRRINKLFISVLLSFGFLGAFTSTSLAHPHLLISVGGYTAFMDCAGGECWVCGVCHKESIQLNIPEHENTNVEELVGNDTALMNQMHVEEEPTKYLTELAKITSFSIVFSVIFWLAYRLIIKRKEL